MPDALTMTDLADMGALVEVQTDATVSRTILRAEGVKVVMFAFDTGQVLTEHTAAWPVLLTVVEGRLRVTADDRDVELLPGGVVHLQTRLPHAVEALAPTKMALVMLGANG